MQAADALEKGTHAKCAGKAYFITNADPQPFWGFLGDFLEPLGYSRPSKKLPWQLIFAIAVLVQFIISLLKPFKVPLPQASLAVLFTGTPEVVQSKAVLRLHDSVLWWCDGKCTETVHIH